MLRCPCCKGTGEGRGTVSPAQAEFTEGSRPRGDGSAVSWVRSLSWHTHLQTEGSFMKNRNHDKDKNIPHDVYKRRLRLKKKKKSGPVSAISERTSVPMLKPHPWLTTLLSRHGKCGHKRKDAKAHGDQYTEKSLRETDDRGRNLNPLISLSGGPRSSKPNLRFLSGPAGRRSRPSEGCGDRDTDPRVAGTLGKTEPRGRRCLKCCPRTVYIQRANTSESKIKIFSFKFPWFGS